MRSWVPPFQIGDKVVRIAGGNVPRYNMYQGQPYTVSKIWWCCDHYGWRITVAESSGYRGNCQACNSDNCGWLATNFCKPDEMASEHTVESLLEELKTTVKEPITV